MGHGCCCELRTVSLALRGSEKGSARLMGGDPMDGSWSFVSGACLHLSSVPRLQNPYWSATARLHHVQLHSGSQLGPNAANRSRHVHTEESLGSLDASSPAVNSVFDTRSLTGGQGIFWREIHGIVGKKLETTTACWGLYAVIREFEHRGRG